MILENVPSPGWVSNGVVLRKEVTKAISIAEIQGDLSPGSTHAADLRAFFLACAALCPVKEKEKEKKAK